jgi:hypothetical protein
MTGACSAYGGVRNAYKILVAKPEGKRSLRRPKLRWEDSIQIDIKEIRFEREGWIHLAQDRNRRRASVCTVVNLRIL